MHSSAVSWLPQAVGSPDSPACIRLRPHQIVATFRMYDALPRPKMSAPWCGLVGINFAALHLTVQSSDHLVEEAGRTLTPATGVKVSYLGSQTVRLSLPRSALGPRFQATSPWNGFSEGPTCPPLNVAVDPLPVVMPAG